MNKKLTLAYFGTPSFAADFLEKLITDKTLPVEIAFVITQPDKPVGKKQILTPSPVKITAQKHALPVFDSVENLHNTSYSLNDIDLALVFAYGFRQFFPLSHLEAPKITFDIGEGKKSGFINIHPSLLPLFRGSSPIAYPILLGHKETGVSFFVMDEKMDHGPIIARKNMPIGKDDMRTFMEQKLTSLGYQLAREILEKIAHGQSVETTWQDHTHATRAPFMVKDNGFISLDVLKRALKNEPLLPSMMPDIIQNYRNSYEKNNVSSVGLKIEHSARALYDFWRGMMPWPGVWTKVLIAGGEKRLKLNEMRYQNNTLFITKVQLEAKKEVDFSTFQKAYGLI